MAQKDPLVEYTAEGERDVHRARPSSIRGEVVLHLFHAELAPPEDGGAPPELAPQAAPGGNGNLRYEHQTSAGAEVIDAALGMGSSTLAAGAGSAAAATAVQTVHVSEHEKLGRNDPCWCGSGKKFKKCHGA